MSMEGTETEYVIVEFPQEQAEGKTIPIALISSAWIFEKEGILSCYWPTYPKTTSKRERAVQNHSELKIKKCTICPIRVKYTTAHYDLANYKLRTMEEEESSQSENSDSGFLSQRFRSSTKNPDYDYNLATSDDDESHVPPVPKPTKNVSFPKKLPVKKTFTDLTPLQTYQETLESSEYDLPDARAVAQQKTQESRKVLKVPVKKTFTDLTPLQIHQTSENAEYDLSDARAVAQQQTQESTKVQKVPVKKTFTDLSPLQIHQETLENTECDLPEARAVAQQPIQCNCEKNTKMLTHLFKDMLSVKRDVQHLLLISERETMQTLPEVDIPKCESAEELHNFNEALKNYQYFQKCVVRLGLIGGKDFSETTRMILVNLIKHNLALQMNFSGKNNKLGLQASDNVLALIKASVRKNPAAAAATDSQIIQGIMIWLRNAPDREGGRTKRKALMQAKS